MILLVQSQSKKHVIFQTRHLMSICNTKRREFIIKFMNGGETFFKSVYLNNRQVSVDDHFFKSLLI
jgi:hypothetical protein